MTTSRRAAVALVAVVASAGLAGCDKPTPGVSMVSGRHVVRTDAQVWCAKNQQFTGSNCQTDRSSPPALRVTRGATIGVDVDREVADNGWVVAISGQRLSGTLRQQFYRLPLNTTALQAGTAEVQVIAVGRSSTASNRGLWLFTLQVS